MYNCSVRERLEDVEGTSANQLAAAMPALDIQSFKICVQPNLSIGFSSQASQRLLPLTASPDSLPPPPAPEPQDDIVFASLYVPRHIEGGHVHGRPLLGPQVPPVPPQVTPVNVAQP